MHKSQNEIFSIYSRRPHRIIKLSKVTQMKFKETDHRDVSQSNFLKRGGNMSRQDSENHQSIITHLGQPRFQELPVYNPL